MTAHGFHVLTADGTLHNTLKEKLPLQEKRIKIDEEKAEIVPNSIQAQEARDIKNEKSHDFISNGQVNGAFDYFDFAMNHSGISGVIVGENNRPFTVLERGTDFKPYQTLDKVKDLEIIKGKPQDLFEKSEKELTKKSDIVKHDVAETIDFPNLF